MNSFAFGIVTILLSWLRSLLNSLWRIGSGGGGGVVDFLRSHWQVLVLCLCIGGFLVDRLVYFFRWRPDYVWRSKLWRIRQGARPREEAPYSSHFAEEAFYQEEGDRQPTQGFAPLNEPMLQPDPYRQPAQGYMAADQDLYQEDAYHQATQAYAPFGYQEPYASPMEQQTQSYAPMQDFAPVASQQAPYPYAPAYMPEAVQPIFDEPTTTWPVQQPAMEPGYGQGEGYEPVNAYENAYENPAQGMHPSFGAAMPEPEAYHFATPVSYMPEPQNVQPVEPPAGSIHPGLDVETFQQNIGLGEELDWAPEEAASPQPDFPDTTYVSFYQNADPPAPKKPLGALSSLAKKARTLVSPSDEENVPSLKDLQPSVDIKAAFHPPVMPKPPMGDPMEGGEE